MGGSDGTLVCRSLDCRKSRAGGGCHRAAQYAPFILPLTAVACSAIFPRLYGIVAGLAVLVLSCFVSASLPHMSIRAGVVVAVALHEIDNAPNAKPCSKGDNQSLQYVYCAVEKLHISPHFPPLCGCQNSCLLWCSVYKEIHLLFSGWKSRAVAARGAYCCCGGSCCPASGRGADKIPCLSSDCNISFLKSCSVLFV